MTHTLGRWEVAKGGRSVNVGYPVYHKCRFEAGLPEDELRSNCRLIAAAPDLLVGCCEAREAILNLLPHARARGCCGVGGDDCSCRLCLLARAIDAATGEEV